MQASAAKYLQPGGLWHQIPAGNQTLRVHRRFFSDLTSADTAATVA